MPRNALGILVSLYPDMSREGCHGITYTMNNQVKKPQE